MDYVNTHALVDTQWVADHLGDPAIRIIDATHFVPGTDRDAAEEFEFRHLPGAVYFDIDVVCDDVTPLPHMLPSADEFAAAVGALGIGNDHRVIVYDGNGNFSAAARVWWMFRVFGHDAVAVMDGGLGRWLRERRPLEHDAAQPVSTVFTPSFRPHLVADLARVRHAMETGSEQLVDARNAQRYAGTAPEPRPTRHRGHIPGSRNVYFADLMTMRRDFALRPAAETLRTFEKAGVAVDKPTVVLCGSGVTAGVNALVLYMLGYDTVAVYDASWAEWGERDDVPIHGIDPGAADPRLVTSD